MTLVVAAVRCSSTLVVSW